MDPVSGKWVGEYVYGEDSPEKRGKVVKFAMELSYDGETVSGICRDEETRDIFSEPASIEGRFENGTLTFFKTYPQEDELDETERLLAKQFNSATIQFKGILKKRIFFKRVSGEGEWEVQGSNIDENGNAQNYSRQGTWKMKRI